MEITIHAKQQYGLRVYGDLNHYLFNETTDEIRERVGNATPSNLDPRTFFTGRNQGGRNKKGLKAGDVTLLQDDKLVYAIRDNVIITVMNLPGKDKIGDMFRAAMRRDDF